MGIEVEKGRQGVPDFERAMRGWAHGQGTAKPTAGAYQSVVVALAVASHAAVYQFSGKTEKSDELLLAAGRHGVDAKAIAGEVTEKPVRASVSAAKGKAQKSITAGKKGAKVKASGASASTGKKAVTKKPKASAMRGGKA